MNYKCLICNQPLTIQDEKLVCINNHSFDQSKSGYYNLVISNKKNSGDDNNMVKTRYQFLTNNYYLFMANKVNDILTKYNINTLLDYACGPGYYLSLFNVKNKYGIDISKNAINIASKHDKSSNYVVANGYHLPYFNQSFDAISVIFAPYDSNYLANFIKDNGYLIIVKPDVNHLIQLKQVLYPIVKLNDGQIDKLNNFKIEETIHISNTSTLNNEQLLNLFSMTPYFYKTKQSDKDKLNDINSIDMTFSFIISVYKKI